MTIIDLERITKRSEEKIQNENLHKIMKAEEDAEKIVHHLNEDGNIDVSKNILEVKIPTSELSSTLIGAETVKGSNTIKVSDEAPLSYIDDIYVTTLYQELCKRFESRIRLLIKKEFDYIITIYII